MRSRGARFEHSQRTLPLLPPARRAQAAARKSSFAAPSLDASTRTGLPLFGSYEPDACPPIPDGCPRDVQSVDDDTCEEVEDAPACREMTEPGWCVDVGNTCYGGADAGIRTSCFADNGYDAIYDVNGIAPAANGCCHPVA